MGYHRSVFAFALTVVSPVAWAANEIEVTVTAGSERIDFFINAGADLEVPYLNVSNTHHVHIRAEELCGERDNYSLGKVTFDPDFPDGHEIQIEVIDYYGGLFQPRDYGLRSWTSSDGAILSVDLVDGEPRLAVVVRAIFFRDIDGRIENATNLTLWAMNKITADTQITCYGPVECRASIIEPGMTVDGKGPNGRVEWIRAGWGTKFEIYGNEFCDSRQWQLCLDDPTPIFPEPELQDVGDPDDLQGQVILRSEENAIKNVRAIDDVNVLIETGSFVSSIITPDANNHVDPDQTYRVIADIKPSSGQTVSNVNNITAEGDMTLTIDATKVTKISAGAQALLNTKPNVDANIVVNRLLEFYCAGYLTGTITHSGAFEGIFAGKFDSNTQNFAGLDMRGSVFVAGGITSDAHIRFKVNDPKGDFLVDTDNSADTWDTQATVQEGIVDYTVSDCGDGSVTYELSNGGTLFANGGVGLVPFCHFTEKSDMLNETFDSAIVLQFHGPVFNDHGGVPFVKPLTVEYRIDSSQSWVDISNQCKFLFQPSTDFVSGNNRISIKRLGAIGGSTFPDGDYRVTNNPSLKNDIADNPAVPDFVWQVSKP